MSYLDIGLIVIIAGFALAGLWYGLVHAILSLLGTIVGIFIATRLYEPVATWIIQSTGWDPNWARVIFFILVFIIIVKLISVIFWLGEKILGLFTKLPGIKGLDKLLGLLFGTAEGVFFLGLILYFIARFPISPWFMEQMAGSFFAPLLVRTVTLLLPLIPDALKMLQSTVDKIM